jgi:nucleoid-associated protein YgaU
MGLFGHGDDKEKQEKQKYEEAQHKLEEARRHQQQQQQQHAPPTAQGSPAQPRPGSLGGQQPIGGTTTPQAGGTGLGAGAGAGTSIAPGHGGPTPVSDEGFESYTVRKGDTLSGIAQHHLGKASAWHEIFDANRGSISDPDKIREGQVIRIPKRGSSGGPRLA